MTNYSTTGFLTDSGRTIKFTIALDMPVVNAEIAFSSLLIQVRRDEPNITGTSNVKTIEFLINEDVMLNYNLSVITQVRQIGIEVTITKPTMFTEATDIQLSVYIVQAQGEFFEHTTGHPVSLTLDSNNYVKCIRTSSTGTYDLSDFFTLRYITCYQQNSHNVLILDMSKMEDMDTYDEAALDIIQKKKNLIDTDYVVVKAFEAVITAVKGGALPTYSQFIQVLSDNVSVDEMQVISDRIEYREDISNDEEILDDTNTNS